MDRQVPPNRYPAAPPKEIRHVQVPSSGREIPIAPPYYPNIAQIGAAGGWVQHPADGQLFGQEQQADGRSQLGREDYRSSSSILAAGGWEQQESVVLPWLENTPQAGQHRRVLAPNSCVAASSNPFLDVLRINVQDAEDQRRHAEEQPFLDTYRHFLRRGKRQPESTRINEPVSAREDDAAASSPRCRLQEPAMPPPERVRRVKTSLGAEDYATTE